MTEKLINDTANKYRSDKGKQKAKEQPKSVEIPLKSATKHMCDLNDQQRVRSLHNRNKPRTKNT